VTGEQNPLGQSGIRRELHVVIGLGEREHLSGDGFAFLPAHAELFADMVYGGAEFLECERVAQAREHPPTEVARKAEFLKLARKDILFVGGIGDLSRFEAVTSRRVDR
jgi:hypothetical protein